MNNNDIMNIKCQIQKALSIGPETLSVIQEMVDLTIVVVNVFECKGMRLWNKYLI